MAIARYSDKLLLIVVPFNGYLLTGRLESELYQTIHVYGLILYTNFSTNFPYRCVTL